MSFALWTCTPQLIKPALVDFDETLRNALSDIVGGPVPEWYWLKASLPCSLVGLGLRQTLLHAPAAYIGSLEQCKPLNSAMLGYPPARPCNIPECVSAVAESAGRPNWLSPGDVDVPIAQHALSRSLELALLDTVLGRARDIQSRALALSRSIPHAGDRLNANPSCALFLHFLHRKYHVCLQYWLGLPIFSESSRCSI